MKSTAAIASLLIPIGVAINFAIAWASSAWIAPAGTPTHVQITPRADGQFDAFSRLNLPGRSLVFHATLAEVRYDPEGAIDVLVYSSEWAHRTEARAGWPMHSLQCSIHDRTELTHSKGHSSAALTPATPVVGGIELRPFAGGGGMTRNWRALPYRPLWLGLIVNSVLYAMALWLLMCSGFWIRRSLRARHGQCLGCGYPVGTSPVCTECGAKVHPTKPAGR